MDFKDYSKILDVATDADLKTIKTSYRRLARKYHPDISSEHDAEKQFKEVSKAYEVLSDEKKREEYDELLKYGSSGQSFEQIFVGGRFRKGAGGLAVRSANDQHGQARPATAARSAAGVVGGGAGAGTA